jgi:hypothetical protein
MIVIFNEFKFYFEDILYGLTYSAYGKRGAKSLVYGFVN